MSIGLQDSVIGTSNIFYNEQKLFKRSKYYSGLWKTYKITALLFR